MIYAAIVMIFSGIMLGVIVCAHTIVPWPFSTKEKIRFGVFLGLFLVSSTIFAFQAAGKF